VRPIANVVWLRKFVVDQGMTMFDFRSFGDEHDLLEQRSFDANRFKTSALSNLWVFSFQLKSFATNRITLNAVLLFSL